MAKVINLRVENILGLKEAEADLNGESAVIGGMNGQGKSSLQRALKMALGGKEFVPAEPVRKGADKGHVFTVLDNGYEVEFSVTPERKTKLTIRHTENPGFRSDSVTLLKSLFGDLSFDPGECMAKGPKELAESLMRLAGLDFTDLNAKRKEVFDGRTVVGREVTKLEGQLAGMKVHEGVPDQEQFAGEIVAELEAIQKEKSEQTVQRNALKTRHENRAKLQRDIRDAVEELQRLQAKKERLAKLLAEEEEELRKLLPVIDRFVERDEGPLRKQLSELGETNRKIRENQERARVAAELKKESGVYKDLTETIDKLDAEKREALAAAKLPIEGLSFDETGVRLNDVPLADCSESERWEIATAIAFALNPGSIVFMSQSGGMDKRTRARVLDRARQLGVQLLLEVVDDAEDVQIVIDRGEVAENRLQG